MEHKTIYGGLGKTLKRISDGMDFGSEITLGYTHYIGGKKLDTPLWEIEEHYERVETPLADLRLGMVFKTEEGKPYTITSFTEDGQPIYGEGELEVEIPEGYWEQFEPQPTEEEVEYMTQEELDASIEVGDEIIVDGKTMRCVDIVDGVPQWTVVNE
jgi:hypothetical protein